MLVQRSIQVLFIYDLYLRTTSTQHGQNKQKQVSSNYNKFSTLVVWQTTKKKEIKILCSVSIINKNMDKIVIH